MGAPDAKGYAGADYTLQDVRIARSHLGPERSQAIAVTAMNNAGAVQNKAREWVWKDSGQRLKSYKVAHIIATVGSDALMAEYRRVTA